MSCIAPPQPDVVLSPAIDQRQLTIVKEEVPAQLLTRGQPGDPTVRRHVRIAKEVNRHQPNLRGPTSPLDQHPEPGVTFRSNVPQGPRHGRAASIISGVKRCTHR